MQNAKEIVKKSRALVKELTTDMRLVIEEAVIKNNVAVKELKKEIITLLIVGASDGFKKEKREYQAKTKAKSDYLKRIQKQNKKSQSEAKRKNSNLRN